MIVYADNLYCLARMWVPCSLEPIVVNGSTSTAYALACKQHQRDSYPQKLPRQLLGWKPSDHLLRPTCLWIFGK